MSNSGALRSLITEAAERTGATLATLSDATAASLGAILEQPKRLQSARHHPHHPGGAIRACLDTLVDAPEVDIVLVAEDLPHRQQRRAAARQSPLDRRASRGAPKASARPWRCSRRCWPARPTTAARCARRSRTCRCCATPSARCGSSMRWRMPAHARSHAGPFAAPPADTELARRWRARAATLDRPTALNEVESKALLGRVRHPAAAGTARPHRRRSRCGGAGRSASRSCSRRCRRRCRTRATPGSCASTSPTPSAVRQAAADHRGPRKLAGRDPRRYAGREAGLRRHRGRARRAARRRDGTGRHVRHGRRAGRAVQGRELRAGDARPRASARDGARDPRRRDCSTASAAASPATSTRCAMRWSISAGSRATLAT